jgi:hypothetical protein
MVYLVKKADSHQKIQVYRLMVYRLTIYWLIVYRLTRIYPYST